MPRWIAAARSRWSALPRAERVAWSLVLLLPLLGLLPAPILARTDPWLAAWVAWDAQPRTWAISVQAPGRWTSVGFLDPWGGPWIRVPDGRTYSPGPNGRDEGLGGDDILVTIPRANTLVERCLARSFELGLALAAVVAWTILFARFVRAPRRPQAAELKAVALQVLLSGACWGGLLYWAMFSQQPPFRWWLRWIRIGSEALHARLPSPPWLYHVAADVLALCFVYGLLCLWLRLTPGAPARAGRFAAASVCALVPLGATLGLLLLHRLEDATPGELYLSLLLAALVAVAALAALAFARQPAPPLPDVEEPAP